jgi:hypothetical protein
MTCRIILVVVLVTVAGCASQRATVANAGQTAGGEVSASPPATDSDATAQSGLVNLVSDLRAAFDAYTAIVQKNQQAGRDIVTETHGDTWTLRILASSWIAYPLIWRPVRRWRQRRKFRLRPRTDAKH